MAVAARLQPIHAVMLADLEPVGHLARLCAGNSRRLSAGFPDAFAGRLIGVAFGVSACLRSCALLIFVPRTV